MQHCHVPCRCHIVVRHIPGPINVRVPDDRVDDGSQHRLVIFCRAARLHETQPLLRCQQQALTAVPPGVPSSWPQCELDPCHQRMGCVPVIQIRIPNWVKPCNGHVDLCVEEMLP